MCFLVFECICGCFSVFMCDFVQNSMAFHEFLCVWVSLLVFFWVFSDFLCSCVILNVFPCASVHLAVCGGVVLCLCMTDV